jgi:prevent-host-death family protein
MTMVMSEKVMSASAFKAKCLAVLDEVAETGRAVVVTKRGKPVARVLPAEEPRSLRGSVRFLVSEEELLAPIDIEWEADLPS